MFGKKRISMRKSLTLLSVCFMTAMSLAGCGSTNAPTDAATQENVEEKSDKTSEEKTVEKPASEAAEEVSEAGSSESETDTAKDAEDEENPYDGGPDWVTLADQFILPTSQMCIEDAVSKYAITLFDGGQYHDCPTFRNKVTKIKNGLILMRILYLSGAG